MNINPLDILKNVKKLQESMGDIQKIMESLVVTGRSGGGMVEIDMNGHMEIVDVRIEPALLKPENAQMIEELIQSASSDAISKVRNEMGSEMGSFVTGLASGAPGTDK
ncbi:MAG: YbaB/EbfC family nucleoid-associated protein [Spirochaetaceae bacterium]|jgi:DNA-binding YbaB/EbfC family protein|nr:YbaB/EbfC family nucleoid-associated protein [Spirochaetaceae bacterium]GMO23744.1 MAG: YbaB/EbfC family nucleoid-associated protein [Termitinemataceae bacterium]